MTSPAATHYPAGATRQKNAATLVGGGYVFRR